MMSPWLKMHCSGALEAGTATTLMANDHIRHSTADSLMLRMSCFVKRLHFVNVFLVGVLPRMKLLLLNKVNLWDSGANDNFLCTHNEYFFRSHEFYLFPLFFRWSFTLVCRSAIKDRKT